MSAGFIAMYATLASRDVDCCLIPESPFYLEGPGGLYEYISRCLKDNGHMVIVIAEGAGQELLSGSLDSDKLDASGNKLLQDVGLWISQKIKVGLQCALFLLVRSVVRSDYYSMSLYDSIIYSIKVLLLLRLDHTVLRISFFFLQDHFSKEHKMTINLKYIGKFESSISQCHWLFYWTIWQMNNIIPRTDPTYMIRAIPSNASDNVYCTLLAQSAIHGAMAGYTGYTSGLVNGRQTYIPFYVRPRPWFKTRPPCIESQNKYMTYMHHTHLMDYLLQNYVLHVTLRWRLKRTKPPRVGRSVVQSHIFFCY